MPFTDVYIHNFLALVAPQNKWRVALPAQRSHVYDGLVRAQFLPHSTFPFACPLLFLAPGVSLKDKTTSLSPHGSIPWSLLNSPLAQAAVLPPSRGRTPTPHLSKQSCHSVLASFIIWITVNISFYLKKHNSYLPSTNFLQMGYLCASAPACFCARLASSASLAL